MLDANRWPTGTPGTGRAAAAFGDVADGADAAYARGSFSDATRPGAMRARRHAAAAELKLGAAELKLQDA